MANSELNALTAATAATGGIYYGEQSGNSRKFTVTAAGATLLEAANAAAQRTALGGTTVGQAVLMLTNPSAVTFPRFNADNTVTARSAANFATDLGLGTGDSPQFTALNIGHASDTTLTRVSAGVIAVEGSTILVSGGALGTPSSGTLSSCTGLPVSTGISGLGTGVATALAAGASTGGNGATDAGKVATYSATGQLSAANTNTVGQAAIVGQSNFNGGWAFEATVSGNSTNIAYNAHVFNGTGMVLDCATNPANGIAVDILDGIGLDISFAAGTAAIRVQGGAVTASAPLLLLTQTWNASGTTFTAVKLNVTNTASAAGSLLMDLQVGSASKFNVTKAGLIAATSSLELYNTAIDGTNYEKLTIDWSSNVLRIAPRSGGTGTGRGMTVGANNLPGYGYIHFAANGNVGIGTTSPGSSYTFAAGDIEFSDTVNLKFATTTGTKIGTATSQKIGFFNATPVVQQTAPSAFTDNTGGTPGTDLTTCGDTSASNQASVINNNFASVGAAINTIRTALTNLGLAA